MRQNSTVITARVDARDLATICQWWNKTLGDRPNSMSFLIKEVVGQMADIMVREHPDVLVDSHQQALEVIEQNMLSARTTKSKRAISRALQTEQATLGAGDAQYDHMPGQSINKDILEVNKKYAGMLQQGMDQAELEIWRNKELARLEREKNDTKVRQEQTIANWSKQNKALDANQPDFQEQYQAREQNKLSELKAGLAGGPAAVSAGKAS